MAEKARTFRPLTPTLVKWETPGQVVEGTLRGKGSMDFEGNTVGQYSIMGDDARLYGVLGGKIIDEALKEVEVGAYLRIVFIGADTTKSGQPINLFDVLLAEEDAGD